MNASSFHSSMTSLCSHSTHSFCSVGKLYKQNLSFIFFLFLFKFGFVCRFTWLKIIKFSFTVFFRVTFPIFSKFLMGLSSWLRQKRIYLQCGRPGFDPWVGKIPWWILQYSCLDNSMDRGTWWPQSKGSQRVRHNWTTGNTTNHNWSLCYLFVNLFSGC